MKTLRIAALIFLAHAALAQQASLRMNGIVPPASRQAEKKQSPFACDRLALSPAERTRHFDELGPALVKLKTGVRELPDGYEFKFPSDKKTFAMLSEFIEQERRCCPFFDITLHIESEGGPLTMRVTGRPGTKEFIQADGGEWIKQ